VNLYKKGKKRQKKEKKVFADDIFSQSDTFDVFLITYLLFRVLSCFGH
jgi:hypothetical protein